MANPPSYVQSIARQPAPSSSSSGDRGSTMSGPSHLAHSVMGGALNPYSARRGLKSVAGPAPQNHSSQPDLAGRTIKVETEESTSQPEPESGARNQGASTSDQPVNSAAASKIKSGSYTDAEYNSILRGCNARRDYEAANPSFVKLGDISLWRWVLDWLRDDGTPLDRSALGVKNFWNRYGRIRSGFDERIHKSANLRTSEQHKKKKSASSESGCTNDKVQVLKKEDPDDEDDDGNQDSSGRAMQGPTNGQSLVS